jgi:hypothetical protein
VAAWPPDIFSEKNQIVNNSTITEAGEKNYRLRILRILEYF